MKYFENYKEPRRIHWILNCTNFNTLLLRLDENINSKYRKKRYPSSYTYFKIKEKLGYDISLTDYSEIEFKHYYNKLKPSNFISSEDKIQGIRKFEGNKSMFRLEIHNEVVAIAVVRKGKEKWDYIAPVASRSKYSYGLILLMEIIKYGIEFNKVYKFTAGKTMYYPYKSIVFLDSKEIPLEFLLVLLKNVIKKIRNYA